MSGPIRSPRGRRGTTATVVALLAVLALAWGAAEAIWLAIHRRTFWLAAPDVARYGRRTELRDDQMLIIGIAVLAVGVLLFAAAVLPARRRVVELAEDDGAIAAGITPRSFRRTLASAAVEVEGISAARVSGRRRLTVNATTTLRDTETLLDRVREHVTARLTLLDPVRSRTVRVHLDRKDD